MSAKTAGRKTNFCDQQKRELFNVLNSKWKVLLVPYTQKSCYTTLLLSSRKAMRMLTFYLARNYEKHIACGVSLFNCAMYRVNMRSINEYSLEVPAYSYYAKSMFLICVLLSLHYTCVQFLKALFYGNVSPPF